MIEETIRNVAITVGATSIEVAPSLEGGAGFRTVLEFVNVSTGGQIISLSYGEEAVAGAGRVLYPTAGCGEAIDPRFTPTQKPVYAIASAAGGSLAVHERIVRS